MIFCRTAIEKLSKQNQKKTEKNRNHDDRKKFRFKSLLRFWTNTLNLSSFFFSDDFDRLYQIFETKISEKIFKILYQSSSGMNRKKWNEIKKLKFFIESELTEAKKSDKKNQKKSAKMKIHMHKSSSLPLQYDDKRKHRVNKSRSITKFKSFEKNRSKIFFEKFPIAKPAEAENRLKISRLKSSSLNTFNQKKLQLKFKRWKQWTSKSKSIISFARKKNLKQKNQFLKKTIGRLTNAVWKMNSTMQKKAPPFLQKKWVGMNTTINKILNEVKSFRENWNHDFFSFCFFCLFFCFFDFRAERFFEAKKCWRTVPNLPKKKQKKEEAKQVHNLDL